MIRKLSITCLIILAITALGAPADESDNSDPASEAAAATAAEVNEVHEVKTLLARARFLEKTGAENDALSIYADLLKRYVTPGKNVVTSEDGILYRSLREVILNRTAMSGDSKLGKQLRLMCEPEARELMDMAGLSIDPLPHLRTLRLRYPFTEAGASGIQDLARLSLEAGRYWEAVQSYRDLARLNSGMLRAHHIVSWYAAAQATGYREETERVQEIASRLDETHYNIAGKTLPLDKALDIIGESAPAIPSRFVYNSHEGKELEGVSAFSASSVERQNLLWPAELSPSGKKSTLSFPAITGNYIVVAERNAVTAFNLVTGKRQLLCKSKPDEYSLKSSREKEFIPMGATADREGRVFFVQGWNNLYAFQAGKQKLNPLWQTDYDPRTISDTPYKNFIFASLPVAAHGRVYILVRDHTSQNEAELLLSAYSGADGRLLYTTRICTALAHKRTVFTYFPGALAVDGNSIIVSTNAGVCGAVRESDGEIIWLRKYERRLSDSARKSTRRRGRSKSVQYVFVPRPPVTYKREFSGKTEKISIFTPADSDKIIGVEPESGTLVLVEPRGRKRFLVPGAANNMIMYSGSLGDELSPELARKTADYLGRDTNCDLLRQHVVGYSAFELYRRWFMVCPASSPGCGIALGESWYIPGRENLYRLYPHKPGSTTYLVKAVAFIEQEKTGSNDDVADAIKHILVAPGRVILCSRYQIQCFKAVEAGE